MRRLERAATWTAVFIALTSGVVGAQTVPQTYTATVTVPGESRPTPVDITVTHWTTDRSVPR